MHRVLSFIQVILLTLSLHTGLQLISNNAHAVSISCNDNNDCTNGPQSSIADGSNCCLNPPGNSLCFADNDITNCDGYCCGGRDSQGNLPGCCGTECIDTTVQLCCNDQPSQPVGDPHNRLCCPIDGDNHAYRNPVVVCGDPATHCCEDGQQCCGTECYPPGAWQCCHDEILRDTAVCCNGPNEEDRHSCESGEICCGPNCCTQGQICCSDGETCAVNGSCPGDMKMAPPDIETTPFDVEVMPPPNPGVEETPMMPPY